MEDIFRLDNKIAVVLGGGGGLGKTIALGLSQHGARLVIASRNMDILVKVAADIRTKSGGEVEAMQVDVSNEDSVTSLVEGVLSRFGTVDILVNAMGLNIKRDSLEYPIEDWDRIFSVNVKGTMIACKHFGKIMRDRREGKIINLSSVREVRGYTGGNAAYCATKGAVGMLTKTLALELAPYNVRVNAIGPSLIITKGTVHIQQNPELAKKYSAMIPLGRLGVPEDLIGTAVFLASGASDFITGQTIFVDGGLTAG